jgi:pimeloyl-ACP methyl ester carboxylesterase
VRQPQVAARLLTLAAALVLAAPVVLAARALVLSLAFLLEFLSDGAVPALTRLTPPPLASAVDSDTDRYRPAGLAAGAPLVLVHGLTPDGKDDPRLRRAARLLARAGFDVAVPTIPGLTRGRLRPDDARPVVAALASGSEPARLVSVSVGAAPAFLAAADPAVNERVRMLLALGAHASALELIRFHLTGEYAWNAVRGRVAHDPALTRALIEANAELADPALRQALATGEAARVDAAIAALPDSTRQLLAQLSPERTVAGIRAPIVLVHGRTDPAVPYSESLRLAAARPSRTRVVLVGAIGHVEGAAAGFGGLADLVRLLGVVYELVALD